MLTRKKVGVLSMAVALMGAGSFAWVIFVMPNDAEIKERRQEGVKKALKEAERCKTIPPEDCRLRMTGPPMTKGAARFLIFLICGGLLLIFLVSGFTVWHTRKRQQAVDETEPEDEEEVP